MADNIGINYNVNSSINPYHNLVFITGLDYVICLSDCRKMDLNTFISEINSWQFIDDHQ